jgi:hypothetical protein
MKALKIICLSFLLGLALGYVLHEAAPDAPSPVTKEPSQGHSILGPLKVHKAQDQENALGPDGWAQAATIPYSFEALLMLLKDMSQAPIGRLEAYLKRHPVEERFDLFHVITTRYLCCLFAKRDPVRFKAFVKSHPDIDLNDTLSLLYEHSPPAKLVEMLADDDFSGEKETLRLALAKQDPDQLWKRLATDQHMDGQLLRAMAREWIGEGSGAMMTRLLEAATVEHRTAPTRLAEAWAIELASQDPEAAWTLATSEFFETDGMKALRTPFMVEAARVWAGNDPQAFLDRLDTLDPSKIDNEMVLLDDTLYEALALVDPQQTATWLRDQPNKVVRRVGYRKVLPSLASRDPNTVREILAEEPVDQDTLLKVVDQWDPLDPMGAFQAWQDHGKPSPKSTYRTSITKLVGRLVKTNPDIALGALIDDAPSYRDERAWAKTITEHFALNDHAGGLEWVQTIDNAELRGRLTRMLLAYERP